METMAKLSFSDANATLLQEDVLNVMKLPSVNVYGIGNNTFRVDIFADVPKNAQSAQNWQGELIKKTDEFSVCYIETGNIKIDGANKKLSSRVFAVEYEASKEPEKHNRFHISFNYQVDKGDSVDAITMYSVNSSMLAYPPTDERGTVGTIGEPG